MQAIRITYDTHEAGRYPRPLRHTRQIRRVSLACLVLVVLGTWVGGTPPFRSTALAAATITVSTTGDELNEDGDCSLREAIQAANTDSAVDDCRAGSGGDTIRVPAGTYRLRRDGRNEDENASGDLDIDGDLTLVGAGAVKAIIDGDERDRVLHILGGTVGVVGLTIRNGEGGAGGHTWTHHPIHIIGL